MINLATTKNVKECSVLFIMLKKNLTFFFQYIFIYITIYINIYLYISLYSCIYKLKKRTRFGHAFFSKERNVLQSFAFFCKRTLHSLRSFKFFAKECCALCALLRALQKNVVFFALFYFLKKRTQKNASLFWVS